MFKVICKVDIILRDVATIVDLGGEVQVGTFFVW